MFSFSLRSKNKNHRYKITMFTQQLVPDRFFSLSNRGSCILHAEVEQVGWKEPLER